MTTSRSKLEGPRFIKVDGQWAVRVVGSVIPGMSLTVEKASGVVKYVIVKKILAHERGISICTFEDTAPVPSRGRRPGSASSSRRSGSSVPAPSSSEEIKVSRPATGPNDGGYVVGKTEWLTDRGGGGGPDEHYWTVTAKGIYRDQYSGRWMVWAHLRPATDKESAQAKRLNQQARREQRQQEAS